MGSDEGSGQEFGAFGDHRDAIADIIVVAIEILVFGLASDDDAVPDAGIFIDDAVFHGDVTADAEWNVVGGGGIDVFGVFFFVVVGTHHDDFFERGAGPYDRTDADDGVGDDGSVEIRAFGDETVANRGADDASRGE